jgi:hypothetical protein
MKTSHAVKSAADLDAVRMPWLALVTGFRFMTTSARSR